MDQTEKRKSVKGFPRWVLKVDQADILGVDDAKE